MTVSNLDPLTKMLSNKVKNVIESERLDRKNERQQ